MNKNRFMTFFLLVAIALFAVSCSADFGKNVYYGGISGVVKDKDNGNGVSGVKVYLYTSESERDDAYNKWHENGGIFSDEKCGAAEKLRRKVISGIIRKVRESEQGALQQPC